MRAIQFLLNRPHRYLALCVLICASLIVQGVLAEGGILDSSFGTNGVVVTDLGSSSGSGVNIVLQRDGKIVMAAAGSPPILVRYNPNGSLDTTFGTNGKVTSAVDGPVALQTDGKLIVGGGIPGGIGLARYTSNGTLDNTFGSNGVVSVWENNNSNIRTSFGDLAVQQDGKIVVIGVQEAIGGNHVSCEIARFLRNGALEEDSRAIFDENNFPESERNFCRAVALQSDGKIILSGHAEPNFSGMAIILGRLKSGSTTSFDPGFGTNGHGTVVTPIASFTHGRGALAIQADGKIVLAGTTNTDLTNKNENLVLIRYATNGTLDSSLAGTGIVITDFGKNEVGNDLAIQSDGKIILAGKIYDTNSSDILLARYNSKGTLDTTFGDGGKVISDLGGSESATAILLQPDSKILAVGAKDGDAVLARYTSNAPAVITKTFKSRGPQDGWILESTEDSNAGSSLDKNATTFNVGDAPKDRQYRSILSFNTAVLPDNAVMNGAQVRIKKQGLVGIDPFTTHGNLILEIRYGLFSNNLDLKPSDFSAPASGTIQDTFSVSPSGWTVANLSSSNLAYINKYGFTQFRVRFSKDDNDDQDADYVKFFSGDSSDINQPQLIITYTLP